MFRLVRQRDEQDCGAACLAMICRFHGVLHSMEQIRRLAGTGLRGSSFAGMAKAAGELGFSVRAVRVESGQFRAAVFLPCIVHIESRLGDGGHFAVLYRTGSRRFYLADPGEGKRRLSARQFELLYQGAAMILEPGSGVLTETSATPGLAGFIKLLRPFTGSFAMVVMASGILSVISILQFIYFRFLVDSVIPGQLGLSLSVISLVALSLVGFRGILSFSRQYILSAIGCNIDLELMNRYMAKMMKLPMSFFDSRKTGEIHTRFDDIRRIRSVLSGSVMALSVDSMMVIGVGSFLFFQAPKLALIMMLIIPLSALLVLGMHKTFEKQNRDYMTLYGMCNSRVIEALSSMGLIKGSRYEATSMEISRKQFGDLTNTHFSLTRLAAVQQELLSAFELIQRIILFWAGSRMIMAGELSFGQLISFSMLSGTFSAPLNRILTMQPAIQSADIAARRVGEILELPDEEPENDTQPEKIHPTSIKGEIEFSGVEFSYEAGRPALENLEVKIPAGSRVGIAGASGCGKSTMMKLLFRLYEADSGSISIDGINIRDLDLSWLRSCIGYVSQDVQLLSMSVYENLIMGEESVGIGDVLEACVKAQALSVISGLPRRFDTILQEGGRDLSGGERQRIALARTLIQKPSVLLLDEATSALDNASQKAFNKTLDSLKEQGVTCVVAAHRLQTLVGCDSIHLMKNGRIIESGSHDELMSDGTGAYRELWQAQYV